MSLSLKVPERPTKQGQKVDNKFDELILILNPNSQGGATGKNWNDTYDKIKEFFPKRHRIVFTKKADDGTNITRKLLKLGYKNIVAVGGDGTSQNTALELIGLSWESGLNLVELSADLFFAFVTKNPFATSLIVPSPPTATIFR